MTDIAKLRQAIRRRADGSIDIEYYETTARQERSEAFSRLVRSCGRRLSRMLLRAEVAALLSAPETSPVRQAR